MEIPVADDSPTSASDNHAFLSCFNYINLLKSGVRRHYPEVLLQVVSLVEALLKGLASQVANSVTLVFGDVEAALLASTKIQNQVVALDDVPDEPLVGPLLLVGPSAGQVLQHMSDSRVK